MCGMTISFNKAFFLWEFHHLRVAGSSRVQILVSYPGQVHKDISCFSSDPHKLKLEESYD